MSSIAKNTKVTISTDQIENLAYRGGEYDASVGLAGKFAVAALNALKSGDLIRFRSCMRLAGDFANEIKTDSNEVAA